LLNPILLTSEESPSYFAYKNDDHQIGSQNSFSAQQVSLFLVNYFFSAVITEKYAVSLIDFHKLKEFFLVTFYKVKFIQIFLSIIVNVKYAIFYDRKIGNTPNINPRINF